MVFSEDSRVKIPCILHLVRLGFRYLSLKGTAWDEETNSYAERVQLANRVKNAAPILHDVGSTDKRKDWVEDFKAGKIDLLFVYNMLLTGFDAKRLKKLCLAFTTKHLVSRPPQKLAQQFFEFVAPMEAKKQKLLQENQQLAQLRDWLLPLLMNGQVKVV